MNVDNGILTSHPVGNNQDAARECAAIAREFPQDKYCFIESYGCQMNEYDAERLGGMLRDMGYQRASSRNDADFIIMNTCCVREHAEKRVFSNVGAIKKLKDEKPSLIVGVCGCMMQQESVASKMFERYPFVDLIFGTHELHKFPSFVHRILSGERILSLCNADDDIPENLPIERSNPFSTNVILMYGCNNFCSYCIVPYVRGRERSREPSDILREVAELAKAGYKEIMLLGQNVNSYRSDDGCDFSDILREINEIHGIERIRFMTSHPKDLSDKLISSMADLDKVCSHIHLPVQSGSTRVLGLMNRGYTREHYIRLAEKLRKNIPEIEITTDIIVGFPTETDKDFAETLSLVETVGFSAAYTFMYSKRQNTPAAGMSCQVDEETKKARLHALNEKCAGMLRIRNDGHIGSKGRVLIEGCDVRPGREPMLFGKLSNFKMVYFPGNINCESRLGEMANVRITATLNNSLIGVEL